MDRSFKGKGDWERIIKKYNKVIKCSERVNYEESYRNIKVVNLPRVPHTCNRVMRDKLGNCRLDAYSGMS